MAERQRMTIEQVVSELMTSEHADVLREALRLVCQELMEADVTALIGAAHGERNPDGRMTHATARPSGRTARLRADPINHHVAGRQAPEHRDTRETP